MARGDWLAQLIWIGWGALGGVEDGFFGAKSEAAVKDFQTRYNERLPELNKGLEESDPKYRPELEVDGKIGENTYRAMREEKARLSGEPAGPADANDGHKDTVDGSSVGPGAPNDPKLSEAAADRAYAAMQGGFLGIGTDEAKLSEALIGQSGSPAAMEQLRDTYRARHGRDLAADVKSELADTTAALPKFFDGLVAGERAVSGVDASQLDAQAKALKGILSRPHMGTPADQQKAAYIFAKSSFEHLAALEHRYAEINGESIRDTMRSSAVGNSGDTNQMFHAITQTLDFAKTEVARNYGT